MQLIRSVVNGQNVMNVHLLIVTTNVVTKVMIHMVSRSSCHLEHSVARQTRINVRGMHANVIVILLTRLSRYSHMNQNHSDRLDTEQDSIR